MELKYNIVLGICILILLYILYKLYFEKRYSWYQYDSSCRDEKDNLCSKLIYTDKFKDGLLVEYFYDIHLDRHLVNAHIASKNRAYRINKRSKIFKV